MLFLAGLGLAALAQAVTRVALLSYLDVTTIQSLLHLYLAPATPFVIVVAVLGNWMVMKAITKMPAEPSDTTARGLYVRKGA